MSAAAAILLWIVAAILAVPTLVFVTECLAGVLPRRHAKLSEKRPRLAVLIPAHNEAGVVELTLASVLEQTDKQDRVVVVADNCSDATAEAARAAGAEVAERNDPSRRGKGYALAFGVEHLARFGEPPEILVIIDADCRLEKGALDALARRTAAAARPAQAVYLMEAPPEPSPRNAVSAFAFLVKNLARPAGLDRLGAPVLLTGTGMALPWPLAKSLELGGGNIVEDMQIGIDAALAGAPPVLCRDALVLGALPSRDAAATSQRTRWEHGHLRTLTTQAPRLLAASLRRASPALLALALELSVPPLAMLVAMVASLALVASALAALELAPWAPALAAIGLASLLALAVLVAWAAHARRRVPLTALLAAPLYVLWKIPLWLAYARKPQQEWVRTDRDAHAPKPAHAAPHKETAA